MAESLNKKTPAILALVIVLVAAIVVGVYYVKTNRSENYSYETGDNGPFPQSEPYVASPTVPPPSEN